MFRCQTVSSTAQNIVVSCKQIVDISVLRNGLAQWTVFQDAAQDCTVDATPAPDETFSSRGLTDDGANTVRPT